MELSRRSDYSEWRPGAQRGTGVTDERATMQNDHLVLKKLSVGTMDNNVYILVSPTTNESIIVDAANEAEKILAATAGTTVRYILQTHAHPDHVQALAAIKEATAAPIAVHPDDAGMLP